jgi:hypothetical protein
MSERKFENQSVKSFKIVIIVLACVVISSLAYIFKLSDRTKNSIISIREERSIVLKDLEKSNLFLQQIQTNNSDLSKKLASEQQKVAKLIEELKSGKVNESNIAGYKQNADNLDNRLKLLLNEIGNYKRRIDSTNAILNTTNIVLQNTNSILRNEKTKNDSLSTSNKNLNKKVLDASKLYYYNLQTSFFKIKSSGDMTETDKSRKINLIKTSFMIAENNFVKPFTKDYYVQIIDIKNNVIGDKKTENFDDNVLSYSSILSVKYDNKTAKAEASIPVNDLEQGSYFINVFDKSKLVLKSTFELK